MLSILGFERITTILGDGVSPYKKAIVQKISNKLLFFFLNSELWSDRTQLKYYLYYKQGQHCNVWNWKQWSEEGNTGEGEEETAYTLLLIALSCTGSLSIRETQKCIQARARKEEKGQRLLCPEVFWYFVLYIKFLVSRQPKATQNPLLLMEELTFHITFSRPPGPVASSLEEPFLKDKLVSS